MRVFHYFLLISFLSFFALPVAAERTYKGGMSYTVIGNHNSASDDGNIKLRAVNQDKAAPEVAADTPSSKVWKKYRSLAAGKSEPDIDSKRVAVVKSDAEIKRPTLPVPPKIEEHTQPPLKPTGFAAILSDYRKNKEQRSQMHSLTITKPSKKENKFPDN